MRGEPQRDARPAGSDTRRDLEPAPMECPIGVSYEVLKFAPKKVRGDGVLTEHEPATAARSKIDDLGS